MFKIRWLLEWYPNNNNLFEFLPTLISIRLRIAKLPMYIPVATHPTPKLRLAAVPKILSATDIIRIMIARLLLFRWSAGSYCGSFLSFKCRIEITLTALVWSGRAPVRVPFGRLRCLMGGSRVFCLSDNTPPATNDVRYRYQVNTEPFCACLLHNDGKSDVSQEDERLGF